MDVAQPPLVVPGGKTTSTRCACGAAECSGSGSISPATIIVPSCALRVVGKETLRGAFPVHDVVVEGAHEVVANGVIASQCWGYFIWTMKRFADEAGLRDTVSFGWSWHILMKGSIVAAAEGDLLAARRSKSMARLLIEEYR